MHHDQLADLCSKSEGQLLEFKQEWYQLSSALAKAKFARAVIAMANGLDEGQVGHIIVGREDPDRDGRVIGVTETPTSEQLIEILGKHARPVPTIRFHPRVACDGVEVSVIEVRWCNYHPHYSMRDVDSILSTDRVVVREGKTTRHLSPPELEMMIRAKDARTGFSAADHPLVVGFVDLPTLGGAIAAVRVRNVSEEPIDRVSAVVDIERVFPPGFTYRQNLFSEVSFRPGESQEFSFRPGDAQYYYPDGSALEDRGKIWSRWTNLVLRITYRDRNGLLQSMVRHAALAG